jgi:hypothetical protein
MSNAGNLMCAANTGILYIVNARNEAWKLVSPLATRQAVGEILTDEEEDTLQDLADAYRELAKLVVDAQLVVNRVNAIINKE